MQQKGIIRVFAVAMALVCIYQLLFTWKTYSVEKEAKAYANGDLIKENRYLDSISNTVVYNFLGLRGYTYKECKEQEINLGLDLRGGMNVILEISVKDVVRALSNYNPDATFQQALERASQLQQDSQDDYLTLFGRAFSEIDPNAKLAAIFRTPELGDKVAFDATNAQVLDVLRAESDAAIDNAFNIIRTRIDRFGVVQPTIQQLETKGRILVELPGIKEPERVLKLLQGSANLEFWETYENAEIYPYLVQANDKIREIEAALAKPVETPAVVDSLQTEAVADSATVVANADSAATSSPLDVLTKPSATDSTANLLAAGEKDFPLLSILAPNGNQNQLFPGSVVGNASIKDTAKINKYLALPQVKELFPRDLRLLWEVKPIKNQTTNTESDIIQLHAIKMTGRDGRPPLNGDVITDARGEFNQMGGSNAHVSMTMNREGAQTWARLTKDNIEKCIAIVLDDQVYSAPRVQNEITGGQSQITGNFTINEATDLANILKSGKLPAKASIIQTEVVGPTLGKESIQAGLMSFLFAIIVVMLYLAFYYNTAGVVADIALFVNMFFLIGVLGSLHAVLTLPGIAGIILTLGMANDANIIIYERIREELRAGKGIQLAISDGYKNAYSAIIDGNVTTLLTGIVLFKFGTGPIQGFATTLVIGILTSMFCAIFISRLIFEAMLSRKKDIKFSFSYSEHVLTNAKYNFIGNSKKTFIISGVVALVMIASFFVQGFNMGIDFTGGRTYTVRFDQNVNTSELQASLRGVFDNNAPEVKTFGTENQVKITTDYLMAEESDPNYTADVDSIVEARLFEGSKYLLADGTTAAQFRADHVMNSQKVGASIADDITRDAFIAVILALVVMFFYIFIRFRNWQFGLGAVVSLAFVALVVIGLYSLLWKIVPFSLEVDQTCIAAVLTIIGYAINDTVIIFDRIREYRTLYPKRPLLETYNAAINSTLSRTLNTSLTTMFVLLVICLFGGEVIRGFTFSLLIGVAVGTYSSICTAAPIVYHLLARKERKELEAAQAAAAKSRKK